MILACLSPVQTWSLESRYQKHTPSPVAQLWNSIPDVNTWFNKKLSGLLILAKECKQVDVKKKTVSGWQDLICLLLKRELGTCSLPVWPDYSYCVTNKPLLQSSLKALQCCRNKNTVLFKVLFSMSHGQTLSTDEKTPMLLNRTPLIDLNTLFQHALFGIFRVLLLAADLNTQKDAQ